MIILIDTNVLISAVIIKESIPDLAVRRALSLNGVIRSNSTTNELDSILRKKKFDRYFKNEYEKDVFINLYINKTQLIEITQKVNICRDPADNMYLELALSGKADCIITGDPDLLVLNPFENIPIITPKEFLGRF